MLNCPMRSGNDRMIQFVGKLSLGVHIKSGEQSAVLRIPYVIRELVPCDSRLFVSGYKLTVWRRPDVDAWAVRERTCVSLLPEAIVRMREPHNSHSRPRSNQLTNQSWSSARDCHCESTTAVPALQEKRTCTIMTSLYLCQLLRRDIQTASLSVSVCIGANK